MAQEHTPGAFPGPEVTEPLPEMANGHTSTRTSMDDRDTYPDDSGLNKKLIETIEKQAALEDSMLSSKAELQAAKARIRELEDLQEEHKQMISSGLLIQKKDVDQETDTLMRKLMEESRQRTSAVESKREIEKELEDLTKSLFEEANKLVVVERVENASLQERNEHLSTQLKDNEILLASHQAQLEELKTVMQRMSAQREDLQESRPNSPQINQRSRWSRDRDSLNKIIANTPSIPSPMGLQEGFKSPEIEDVTTNGNTSSIPDYQNPEQSAGLLMPRYRTDTTAFAEFMSLLFPKQRAARPVLSRQGSAADLPKLAPESPKDAAHLANSPSRVVSANMERSVSGSTNASTAASPAMSSIWNRYATMDTSKERELTLRETKFLKRAIVEDIDPTLRLDLAPDLGYLTRRAIQSAVLDGHLIVEPVPSHLARYAPERLPCALCAESRYEPGKYERNFRLKTSEKPDTQTHSLCNWCTDRVRSVCTYVMFLKQVKDGLWRVESEGEEMRVWEESVKLRECMFWSRIGHILES